MKIVKSNTVLLEDVNLEGAVATKMRWLISKEDKAPNFAMRLFEVDEGGETPYHTHQWEHEAYVLEGSGYLRVGETEYPFSKDDVIYVEPELIHQFVNNGSKKLKFLCLVPIEYGQQKTEGKKKVSKNPFSASKQVNNC